jgi:hypothetical protein
MFILPLLLNSVFSLTSLSAHRLLQYQTNATDPTVFGSTRVAIDHEISPFDSKPSSSHVVFIPLESADVDTVASHLNATSPVVFLVNPSNLTDVSALETFLTSTSHKAPIYFSYEQAILPAGFTHVKTADAKSNSPVKRTKLQNVIGTINSSSTFDSQRIAVISAPFDSFSVVPSASIGWNNNGLSATVLLEILHQICKFPPANNWVFVFALTDGHFCGLERLERVVNSLNAGHSGKVEFAVSLESLTSPRLSGWFGQRIKRDSAFAKFVVCLIDSMKSAGIPFETSLGDAYRTQKVFSKSLIQSIAVTNDDLDETSHITDLQTDVERANGIVWAVTEALLRMMYDADSTATMIDRVTIDAGHWAGVIAGIPRMAAFRDQSAAQVIAQWMRKFGTVSVDEWTSGKCVAPFSATSATLVLYTPVPASRSVVLALATVAYGGAIFLAMLGIGCVRKRFA